MTKGTVGRRLLGAGLLSAAAAVSVAVLVSPMREDVCWYYEKGGPFLLLEAATGKGVRRRARTASSIRWRR